MRIYTLKYPIAGCEEFQQAALDGHSPRAIEYGSDGCPEIIKTEPIDATNKEHAQLLLDAYYTDVIACSVLIPDFRRWLRNDLSEEEAELVIGNIKWFR